jgi:isopropylmalate/homocitrate/citramalate synthase
LTDLYRLVERASGYPVHPLAPVVGRHAYSPIGIAMEELDPYLMNPILPQTVGNEALFSPNLCMEDFAVERKLRELGLDPAPHAVAAVADALKERLRIGKTELDDEAISAVAAEVQGSFVS